MAADSIQNLRFDDVRAKHLLIALSGGADSVALLRLLCERQKEYALTLTAAHFHHGIRASDADADAAFCRDLCRKMNIPYIEGKADVPAYARAYSLGLETAARQLRYDFLRKTARETGANHIALAHHLNDQAETILMHLLRGSGMQGVCGMTRLQDDLYRPLLEIPKDDLVQFLRRSGIVWREDQTNFSDDNPRNALRLNVLPEIEKSYPSAVKAIVRFGAIAASENDLLSRMTDEFLTRRMETGPYGCRLMLQGDEDAAILRRAIRKIAGEALSMEKTETILGLKRGKMEISSSLQVERSPSALYFLRSGMKLPGAAALQIPGETILDGICRVLAEVGIFPFEPDNPLTECLALSCLDGAQLRLRQNGDRIHPLGAAGQKLLSDYLIDKKIDRPLRNCMPVIAQGNQVLWAGGVGIAHPARIQNDTERMVRLTIVPITDEKAEVQI